jgi:hypothetical protein
MKRENRKSGHRERPKKRENRKSGHRERPKKRKKAKLEGNKF